MNAKTLIGLRNGRQFWLRRIVLGWGAVGAVLSTLAAQPEYVRIDGLEVHPTRILARFRDTVVVPAATGTVSQLGSRVAREYKLVPRLVALEDAIAPAATSSPVTDEAAVRARLIDRINALKLSGMFEYVEPDYIVRPTLAPTDAAFVDGRLWGLRNLTVPGADISATNAWDLTTGSTNVIVAVIDTGIRYTHRDLTNQMWVNPGETPNNSIDDDNNGYVDDIHGINAILDSGDPIDVDDHGTHVAGTIGAAANDGNPAVGVAWKVRLMGCKFISGTGSTANAIQCIEYAVANGARILNNSWGSYGSSSALRDAIDAAGQQGVLFVAAAGNDAINNDGPLPHYPSSYPLDNIVAVAAIDRFDALADFSNYGLSSVDLGAPGVSIFSCFSESDTSYDTIDGTSMATPHVSGVAALILSLYPSADLSELTGRLLGGAVPIPSLNGLTATGGRLNAYNALTLSGNGILQTSVTPPSGSVILSGSAQPIFVEVSDLFGVNFATVTGQVLGITNLVFANDGTAPDVIANNDVYSAMFQVPVSTGSVTLTVTATATNKVGVTNQVYYTILPPPPNDYFTNATKVPAGGAVYLANNRFATIEAGEPNHAGVTNAAASLWWSYSAASDTNLFIDTTGSTIDTVLAVYTGTTLSNLQVVASTNNIGARKQAYLSLPTQTGIAYRIAVASVSTNSLGSIQLRVAPGGGRDVTAPAVFVSSPLSGLGVSNQLITVSGTALDPSPDVSGVSEVFLSVNGAIASSAVGTTNWNAPALLQPGINTLRVSAVDAAGNSSPTVTVQVYYLPNDPPNDIFANALPLTATPERVEAYSTNATKEFREPNHAGNAGGKSVWWKYLPPGDGVLVLNTTNSSFDTLLALYTGTIVTNLTQIAANDDAPDGAPGGVSQIVQAVRANTLYYIAVDGYDGVSGRVTLNYSFAPATLSQLTINTTGGGTTSPSSMEVANNSIVSVVAVPDADFRFDRWDGDVVSSSNPISVLVDGNKTITAHFVPITYTDGFESGHLSPLFGWTTGGSKPWIVQNTNAAAGTFAARSGEIGDDQTSSLFLSGNYEAGVGSFALQVSSESGWDFLKFFADGDLMQQWSGEVGWINFAFPVTAGQHAFEWRYQKDSSGFSGRDAAFIDNLILPVMTIRMTDVGLGSFQVVVTGSTNQLLYIQASTDLASWQTIATNQWTGSPITFTDPGAPSYTWRYYRVFGPR